MMDTWPIGLFANGIVAISFLAIAITLARALTKTKQWSGNPLAVGTCMLYLTCGIGHGIHAGLLVDPLLGLQPDVGLAARGEYEGWYLSVWDFLTASAGLWYWSMWRKFPDLVSGAAVYEDLRERQRRALEVHDGIVQGLVKAKLALDMDQSETGATAVDETLQSAKHIISDLLGSKTITAGDLRRTQLVR